MKFSHKLFTLIGLTLCTASSAKAIVVVVSATAGNTAVIAAYVTANFSNVTEVRQGNFAVFSAAATTTALTGADLVIIGRTLASAEYDVGDAAGYNSLALPVVSLTSYVSRPDATRLGWHSGGVNATLSAAGTETTITTDGTPVFGSSSPADWFPQAVFNAAGTGTVGGGKILATIGGQIVAAGWRTGDAYGTAGSGTAGANRLLFNLDDTGGAATAYNSTNLTDAGRTALNAALVAFTPLLPIPEPSASVLGLAGLLLLARRKRS